MCIVNSNFYFGIERAAGELGISVEQASALIDCGLLPVAAFADVGDESIQLIDPDAVFSVEWEAIVDSILGDEDDEEEEGVLL